MGEMTEARVLSCCTGSYRTEPLLLVQKLGHVLRRGAKHALLLQVLYSSLWFFIKPVQAKNTGKFRPTTEKYHSL